jgi:hypothetical protein
MTVNNAIHDTEAQKYINKLIDFFGLITIEKCLKKYQDSLACSGPVYKRHYLKLRHPWWESFTYYFELQREGKSIRKNLDLRLKNLAGDGKKISVLQSLMPSKVRDKFKKNLLDENRAYDFLYELDIAWHYLINDHQITWYEEDGKPDFLVEGSELSFNVECKRVTVDASRKIWRKDLYRFVEKLLPEIEKLNLKGSINLILNSRLHSSDTHIQQLSNQMIEVVKNNGHSGKFYLPQGEVHLDLEEANFESVDLKNKQQEMWKNKPHESHGVIYASDYKGKPVDAIEFLISSKKADKVLEGIKDKIKDAAIRQIPKDKPGVISCFLEDIADLTNIANDSGLQLMANYLLNKEELSHIAAIAFCAEPRVQFEESGVEYFNSQGLLFRNAYCSFENAKDYPYLSAEL